MATYTNAQIEPLAQRMVQQLPGLDINLARVWIRAESGVGNNPLGVTSVQGRISKLNTYSTPIAGIDAAINLLKSSSYYAGIRTAISSGSVTDQAKAIIASPWHSRGSPYYTDVFTKAGFLSSTSPIPGGGASTPITQLPSITTPGSSVTQDTLTADQWNAVIAELHSKYGWTSIQKISATNFADVVAAAKTQGLDLSNLDWTQFYGKYVSDLRDNLSTRGIIPGANLLDFNFDIVAAVMFIGVILVGITLIGTGGLIAIKGKK